MSLFLSVQMHQAAIIKTSIKKGWGKACGGNCQNHSKKFPTQTIDKQQQNTPRTDAQKSLQSPHGKEHNYILPPGIFSSSQDVSRV
jgi:hypothetical protein